MVWSSLNQLQQIVSILRSKLSLGIPFDHCKGQGYDGARNFQGHVSGVAKKFQQDNRTAISVHCLAHCVNLCLQDIARNIKSIKDALNFSMEIIQLIKYSPKTQVVFEKLQSEHGSESIAKSGIRTLCPTRWTVRNRAIQAILDNYETLRMTLEESSHGSDDCSRRACGMLALMDKFQTYFGLKLAFLVFSITEQLSLSLQGVQNSVDDCYVAANVTIQALKKLRKEEEFRLFFESVKEEASDRCDPPQLTRQRRQPLRLNDGAAEHRFQSVEDIYRKDYYQVIDSVAGELESRFMQESFVFVRSIETLLLDSANSKPVILSDELMEMYKNDIIMEKLKLQLQLLPDAINSVPIDGIRIKEVTRVQTICDVFNSQPGLKNFLVEVHKLLKIYMTIPVTTSSSERNFSALKRVKTYLRNSMTQSRLNHCMLVHVHQDKTDTLNICEIANDFIRCNEKRIEYFGQ